jgi:hypothetical protein
MACDSVRREVLWSILIEFGVPMKLSKLVKMCSNETYSKVCIGKNLSDFSYRKWSKIRRCFITTAFLLCFRICHWEGAGKQVGVKLNGILQL